MSDIKKMKVAELKEELTKHGLSTVGKKDELTARLEQAVAGKAGEEVEVQPTPEATEEATKEAQPKSGHLSP